MVSYETYSVYMCGTIQYICMVLFSIYVWYYSVVVSYETYSVYMYGTIQLWCRMRHIQYICVVLFSCGVV